MKRSLALLLTFIVCLSFAGSAFAAEKDGKSFAVVVLNVNDMWSVSENLLNEAFSAQ